ncbi:MAG: TauD/TfdA family dioxygenase [Alphaproteobacteria bacterium]|nr:TauD/TfdA family dioxygenase [Alphaproteobacteria bacterium]MCY4318628.1 TauD/TfdA family dioxygenase [Alphaproteobacteria bacterium]
MTRDEFVCHHSWNQGDIVMWDERATMHRGANDDALR